jgi:hypothetical protein
MSLDDFLQQLRCSPESIEFDAVVTLIDSLYDFTSAAFRNGAIHNRAGANPGACKLLPLRAGTACQKAKRWPVSGATTGRTFCCIPTRIPTGTSATSCPEAGVASASTPTPSQPGRQTVALGVPGKTDRRERLDHGLLTRHKLKE